MAVATALKILVVLASTKYWGFAFETRLATRKRPAANNLFVETTKRRNYIHWLQQDGSIDEAENNPASNDIHKNSNQVMTVIEEELETLESTTTLQSFPDSVAQIMDAFVSIKEQVYGIIRQRLSDLITIIQRSAKKARDWAVDDEMGQLVSSGLFVVGFYALVAAFAAWNIEVLSGGKSKWSGPKNGVTVPVVRGLPNTSPEETVIRFQKPKWKAPKIQTSYSKDSNSNKDTTGLVGSESSTK